MKQRLLLMLTVVACAIGASAADFEVDGIWYNLLTPSTVEVAPDESYGGEIVIPENVTYEDITYTVRAIGDYAFRDRWDVYAVTIPNTVTRIGDQAFMSSNLAEVTIPESVTAIGEGAFGNCPQLSAIRGKYASDDNTVLIVNGTLIAYLKSASLPVYNIPATVTRIGHHAFYDCKDLKFVTIPGSVKSIGDCAFQSAGLRSINIPNSVTAIGNNAFCSCENLKAATLSGALTTIKASAFNSCRSLVSVTIPGSVITIENEAFRGCENLTEVVIPNSVKEIQWCAFAECHSLREITIPDSVVYIGDDVFYGCESLNSISSKLNTGDSTCAIFGKVLVRVYPDAQLTSFTVPDNVTKIGGGAFRECTDLQSVVIPSSVTSIGDEAFMNCQSLTSITIPNSVTEIGGGAFQYCLSLQSITLPKNLTEIRWQTFWGCDNLISITFPENLRVIGFRAFTSNKIKSLTLPGRLERIDSEVFWFFTSLESITLPQSLVEVGDNAFPVCTALREVKGKFASADHRCLIDNDGRLKVIAAVGLTEYTVPDGVKSIGSQALPGNDYGTLRILTLPNTVEEIGCVAFAGHRSLTTINMSNSVTRIVDGAFSGLNRLESIVIPAAVQEIGNAAFNECNSMRSVTIEVTDPNNISYGDGGDPFSGFDNYQRCTLYVPAGSKGLYSTHWCWGRFANIVEMESTATHRFSVEDLLLTAGEVTMLPVTMVNDDDIIGVQFDVMLPEGFELDKGTRGRYYLEGSDRFDDHKVTAQEIDGGVRFVVFSSTNSAFDGNDGVLFSLPVIATGDERTEAIVIREIIITDSDFNEIELPLTSLAAKVLPTQISEPVIPGDVNGDGRYTITDVTAAVAYVLGDAPAGTRREAADVNGDGEITVSDITMIISSVLAQ